MLNENIKSIRKEKGYTQETLAAQLNVVRQTVSKWEKGYSVPDAIMLEKLAELFDVSVSDLLGEPQPDENEKADLQRFSEQLSVLNNQFARELSRKRRNRKIAFFVMGMIFFAVLVAGALALMVKPVVSYSISDNEISFTEVDSEFDKAVGRAIMDVNKIVHYSGECPTESHFILSIAERGNTVTACLYESYSVFGFYNGFFTVISGHGVPAVYKFKKNNGLYEFADVEYPQDGDCYVSSIKKMFPYKYAAFVLNGLNDEINNIMWLNKVKQAQSYLEKIGRNAIICRYGDIEWKPMEDFGITTDVDNKICSLFSQYDGSISNCEYIEDGVRYVYQTDYDTENDLITFTKFEYDTNKIIEYTAVDGETGEIVKDARQPEKAKYKMGKLVTDSEKEERFTTIAYYE